MAGLDSNPQPIPFADHLRAVAFLRGRLFVNSLRRKGGVGELIGQILTYPALVVLALFPIAGAGFGAFAAVHFGKPQFLSFVYGGIFVLWVVISINLAPPGLAFDPESLIRFPLSFSRYLVIRLFLGLLSASTVVGSLALCAAALGIGVADSSLFLPALFGGFALALANMLMTRMIFAWVDRWLSTRRAREVFTGLIFLFAIGMQYLNITFNGLGNHGNHAERAAQQAAKIASAKHLYHAILPLTAWLPPGLAAQTVTRTLQHQPLMALLALVGLLAYAALFLAVFAWRTETEFRGESLSDSISPAQRKPVERVARAKLAPVPVAPLNASPVPRGGAFGWTDFGLPGTVAAVLTKEFTYIRRNTAMFFGLFAPLILVILFVGKVPALRSTGFAFPGGVAYALLGVAAMAYNSFGLDQAGIQLYFLAPVRFRSIVLAKNMLTFAIVAAQVTLIYAVVFFSASAPSLTITAVTVLWVVFAIVANTTLGNYRSLVAPKKMEPGKLARKQASQLSAFMSVFLMFTAIGIVVGLYAVGHFLHMHWIPVGSLLVLASCAIFGYIKMLDATDRIAIAHRETLIEELCKAS